MAKAVQRVKQGRFLVPAGDPDLRRGGEGQVHDRPDQNCRPAAPRDQHFHQSLVREQKSMIASPRGWAVLASLVAIALPARAQQRPSEEELFGPAPDGGTPAPRGTAGPSPERATETPASSLEDATIKGEERSRDQRALSSPPTSDLFASEPNRDNPLTIGGQIYLRSIVQASESQALGKDRFFLPALVDGYFDARPSDRVRGMILVRLTYDPTLDSPGNADHPSFASGASTTGR